MSRTYRGIEARTVIPVKYADGTPTQFIWRDRLYRVDAVLQQWECSPSWWQDVRTLATGSAAADLKAWRVEASSGPYETQGVYELGFDPAEDRWYLIRTHD